MSDTKIFSSPLRYPGGKRKLVNFMKLVFVKNGLIDGDYIEPYAGGASVALGLLFEDYARRVYINDVDPAVFAFWQSVLNRTDEFCKRIETVEVTIDEWHRQKAVQIQSRKPSLELGFSTFFLNRTNRSGVISGGVIGGKTQKGKWRLDARFNKDDLIERIRRIARQKDRIIVTNLDALQLIKQTRKELGRKALVYLDPPYYVKGQQALYRNFYEPSDHALVATQVCRLQRPWIVSYDDVPAIRHLYSGFQEIAYKISYSAQDRYKGSEVIFASSNIKLPNCDDPTKVRNKDIVWTLFPEQQ